MASVKKKLCDPPAIEVARAGDPKLAGLFKGALLAVDDIQDATVKRAYVDKVVAIETTYMARREEIAKTAIVAMEAANAELLKLEDTRLSSKR